MTVCLIDGVLDQVGGGAGRATLVGSYCAWKWGVNKYQSFGGVVGGMGEG